MDYKGKDYEVVSFEEALEEYNKREELYNKFPTDHITYPFPAIIQTEGGYIVVDATFGKEVKV